MFTHSPPWGPIRSPARLQWQAGGKKSLSSYVLHIHYIGFEATTRQHWSAGSRTSYYTAIRVSLPRQFPGQLLCPGIAARCLPFLPTSAYVVSVPPRSTPDDLVRFTSRGRHSSVYHHGRASHVSPLSSCKLHAKVPRNERIGAMGEILDQRSLVGPAQSSRWTARLTETSWTQRGFCSSFELATACIERIR